MAILRKLRAWLERLEARIGKKPAAPSPESLARGHEGVGINFRVIGGVAIGIIVSAVIIHFALLLLMLRFEQQAEAEHGPAATAMPPEERFPAPRLQVDPAQELIRLRAGEDTLLENYAWVDRSRGLIRIPIERAMDLLASPSAAPGRTP